MYRKAHTPKEGSTVAVYVLNIHENLLQTFVPVKYMDVELAYVGSDEGTDVFVGGASRHGELYRHLFHISSNSGGAGGNQVIHNLDVSSDPYELRIISNSSSPNHLVIRMYYRSIHGQTLGIMSEYQMMKLAD
ncbi:hypothetical protein [Paenibacillus sp. FSL R5-0519]|uniref:hypothetical protein n=1 Tax=Paenibacillus sp. FSL R5-0519 TaxID=2921648 RepID=UPI0030D95E7E